MLISAMISTQAIADEKNYDEHPGSDPGCDMEMDDCCEGDGPPEACPGEPAKCPEDDDEDFKYEIQIERFGEGMGMHGMGMEGTGMHGMGMYGMGMHQGGPWEMPWYDRPWDFWRHVKEDSLDYDAIHFMSNVRRIAILPFIDMTDPTIEGYSRLDDAGGPRRLADNLAAEFMNWGYLVIPQPDVEAFFTMYMSGNEYREVDTMANNQFFFDNMPNRAMDFYTAEVPGLNRYGQSSSMIGRYLTREDYVLIGEMLEADCIVRGFVNEYAVTSDIDADWRTFIPPFLGLINPDRRVTMEVAYYLYDAHSGEMIWNGTVDIQNDANWPMFTSDRELIRKSEQMAALQMTEHVLPGWHRLLTSHPAWVPFQAWDDPCWDYGDRWDQPPNWLNPMRMGWHDTYERNELRFENEPVENPPERPWFRDASPSYNGIRRYLGER
jgi:hypothetical protein